MSSEDNPARSRNSPARPFYGDGELQFHYPTVTMADVATLHYGKALVSGDRGVGDIPVYGTNGVTGYHNMALGTGPTVILGRKGMGNLGVEWCASAFWVIDTAYYTTFARNVDPRFFYYFNKLVGLNHLKDGTSNPSLSRDTFLRQRFPLPELETQNSIAAILTSLDDKIEANRRMNATLAALARALFKSWFVDFDPVRAKMEGRDLAMAPDLAALFPDALVDSAPGPIPEGWDVRQLREVVSGGHGEIRTGPFGSQLHQADYSQTGTPVVMPANLIDGSIDQNGIARIDDGHVQRLKDHQLRLGDIVYGRRGDIGRKALVGPDEVGWLCGTGCLRIRCASDRCPPSYLFHYLGHEPIREWIATRAIGATMPNLNTGILGEVEVLLPTNGVAMAFDAIVAPLDGSSRLARRQSSTLTQLRDLLLPRLLSGALRVRDAERLIGDAA